MEMAVREVLAVARGSRAALSDDAVEHALAWLDRHAADSAGNMLKDVAPGRPSELEPRSAQSCGRREVPCHALPYSCLLPQELRRADRSTFPQRRNPRETEYFGDPSEPGPSRAQWVERMH